MQVGSLVQFELYIINNTFHLQLIIDRALFQSSILKTLIYMVIHVECHFQRVPSAHAQYNFSITRSLLRCL